MSRYKIWKAIVEEKVDVMIDEHNREWIDKKDFNYLYFEYRSLLITNFFLLLIIMALAVMYMLLGMR